jgi:hypothetical protein
VVWAELVDPWGRVEVELGEDVALWFGDLGALPEEAGWPGEGADGDAVQLSAKGWPGARAGGFDEAGQKQREPAEYDVGADALLLAVVDRA